MKNLALTLILLGCSSQTLKLDKKPTIVAHRGASGYLPEHTLEGFSMAHGWGVPYIEPDVVLTRDNKLVILHDIHLDSTTNVANYFPNIRREDGRFYAIDFTLSQIKKLSARERVKIPSGAPYFPQRFPHKSLAGLQVPSLQELIDLVKGLNKSTGRRTGLYIEAKHYHFHKKEGKNIARALIHILTRNGLPSEEVPVIIQSFEPEFLKLMKKAMPQTFRVQLIGENSWKMNKTVDYDYLRSLEGVKSIKEYAQGVGPWIPHLVKDRKSRSVEKSDFLKYVQAHKLICHPYTARKDSLYDFAKDFKDLHKILFKDLGVDGVFSDFADESLKIVGR